MLPSRRYIRRPQLMFQNHLLWVFFSHQILMQFLPYIWSTSVSACFTGSQGERCGSYSVILVRLYRWHWFVKCLTWMMDGIEASEGEANGQIQPCFTSNVIFNSRLTLFFMLFTCAFPCQTVGTEGMCMCSFQSKQNLQHSRLTFQNKYYSWHSFGLCCYAVVMLESCMQKAAALALYRPFSAVVMWTCDP